MGTEEIADIEVKDEEIEKYESSMSWLKNSMRFFDTRFIDSIMK